MLFESMFDTVIEARDFLLKPGGAILPDVATIHVAGFGRNATSLPFWDDVYGFEMPSVQKSLAEDAIKNAIVAPVKGAHVVTDSREIKRLDLATVAAKDLDFTAAEVVLVARTDGVRGDEPDSSIAAGAGEGATGLTQRSVVLDADAGGTYAFERETTVTRVATRDDGGHEMTLASTIAHPAGGGQPSDSGRVVGANGRAWAFDAATRRRETGEVAHAGRTKPPFEVGDACRVTIDGAKRVLHARIHSAGHALDVAMIRAGLPPTTVTPVDRVRAATPSSTGPAQPHLAEHGLHGHGSWSAAPLALSPRPR